MTYIIQHSTFVFLFFLIPLLGWLISKYIPSRLIIYIIAGALTLLLPVITGYGYIIDNGYGYLIYILLTCGYALVIAQIQNKTRVTLSLSGLLFIICGFFGFIGVMAGTISIEQEWQTKGYRVRYMHDQGFSGGALITYQLDKYAVIPMFIKQVDSKWDNDTTNNCWVKFPDEHFNFNKCHPDSSFLSKQ